MTAADERRANSAEGDVAVRLELVRLVHRFDRSPEQVIEVATAYEAYVLGTKPRRPKGADKP